MTSRSLAFFALFSALTLSSVAHADVVPPAGDCEGKAEGDSCKDERGTTGACGTMTSAYIFTPPFPDAATQTDERTYFGCRLGATPKKTSSKGCGVGSVGGPCSSASLSFLFLAAIALVRRRAKR